MSELPKDVRPANDSSADESPTEAGTMFLDDKIEALDEKGLNELRRVLASPEDTKMLQTLVDLRIGFGLEDQPREGFTNEMIQELNRNPRTAANRRFRPHPDLLPTVALGTLTGALTLVGTGSWNTNPLWATVGLVVLFGVIAGVSVTRWGMGSSPRRRAVLER